MKNSHPESKQIKVPKCPRYGFWIDKIPLKHNSHLLIPKHCFCLLKPRNALWWKWMQHGAKMGFICSFNTFVIKMSPKLGNSTAEVLHVFISKKIHKCFIFGDNQICKYSMQCAFGSVSCKYCWNSYWNDSVCKQNVSNTSSK